MSRLSGISVSNLVAFNTAGRHHLAPQESAQVVSAQKQVQPFRRYLAPTLGIAHQIELHLPEESHAGFEGGIV